ncbi:ferric/cupric-chelate reductase [Podila minutissima]|uniref:Ferric/cupric-chelate reductase n=1 Tax=Podila minutissima TaxID=64525 RepID=A0A9P5VJW7_9FUNG|nr:ferric/cupric-chelate reductase [Podila minutissima]
MANLVAIISLLGMLVMTGWWLADYETLWGKTEFGDFYFFAIRDYYFLGLCVLPSILSHLVTIWGHYYRADAIFQESITRVSSADKKQKVSIWERKDSYFGCTVKYYVLVFIATGVNLAWFGQPMQGLAHELAEGEPFWPEFLGSVGYGSGYAAMGACGMILFLVLRRSMLHAVGFTYAELLPLHRWMGVAIIFWSVIHTIGYMGHLILDGLVSENINFDGETRGPQNILGFVALAGLLLLGLFSIPYMRRRFYTMFMYVHRYGTIVTLAGTLMHYPYFMTWYYVIPSVCLFMADRFVPRIIQAFTLAPEVMCTFDKDSDILTMVIVSSNKTEPLKPYYPGDYVNLEVVAAGKLYHPFTIASYWAEDPYSMTLYIRTFEGKDSWTHTVAKMCGNEGKVVTIPCNIDGVFGDRNHDYLGAHEIVFFAAGAAITTFMPLIKAMAAQIEVDGKSAIRGHLICTFRFESELYAYGEFMHRVTHDRRFTSWLRTEIYVTRDNRIPLDHVFVPAIDSKKTENVSTSSSDSDNTSIDTVKLPASNVVAFHQDLGSVSDIDTSRYADKSIPTFLAADSGSASTLHARRDMFLTAFMLIVPAVVFIAARHVPWEGTWDGKWRWCITTEIYDQNMTNKCMWNYTMTPGLVHIIAGCFWGYLGLWYARRRHAGRDGSKVKVQERSAHMREVLESQVQVVDGSIHFVKGRLDAAKAVEALVAAEVGMDKEKTTAVFVGGPDSFLDAIEKEHRRAKWTVDFHRETWSP